MAFAQSISGHPEAPVMDMTQSRDALRGVMAVRGWGHLLSPVGTRDVPKEPVNLPAR